MDPRIDRFLSKPYTSRFMRAIADEMESYSFRTILREAGLGHYSDLHAVGLSHHHATLCSSLEVILPD